MSGKAKYSDIQTAAVLATHGEDEVRDEPVAVASASTMVSMDVHLTESSSATRPTTTFTKGELQAPAYRDKECGVLFLTHLGIMVSVAAMYAAGALETDLDGDARRLLLVHLSRRLQNEDYEYNQTDNLVPEGTYSQSNEHTIQAQQEEDEDDTSKLDLWRFLSTLILCLGTAPILAIAAMRLMMTHAIFLLQGSLYFGIGLNLVLGLVLSVLGGPLAGLWFLIFAAILVCYAKAVWHRIPFAAANLQVAVTCVQSNLGMTLLALLNIPIIAFWTCLWAYVFTCVWNSPWMKSQEIEVMVTDDAQGFSNTHEDDQLTTEGGFAMAGLLLSFYWTYQVIKNVVHTTLAGTVGTWWFLPHEANHCCSPALLDSWSRSLTYSFGSICLGSLIVAILQVIQSSLNSASRNRCSGILRLVAQCLLEWIEPIVEYFNKWAFVYIGLYGYSYVEAGKNVITLFRNRGWTALISDSLVNRMLVMIACCIGFINGIIASLLTIGSDGEIVAASFFIAVFFGMLLSSMVFGVLISAVDSIIVLYAEAPLEFAENHPALAHQLQETWSQAWPDLFTPAATAVVATPVV